MELNREHKPSEVRTPSSTPTTSRSRCVQSPREALPSCTKHSQHGKCSVWSSFSYVLLILLRLNLNKKKSSLFNGYCYYITTFNGYIQ
jgi:hypothetical protein